jgi:hypothetical protein
MAGLVSHNAGKTGQRIARAARVIENGESFDGVTARPHLFAIGEDLYSCGDRVYLLDGERSPTSVVQPLLASRPKLARTGPVEMNQDC